MPAWDSADLLAQFNSLAGRRTTDAAVADADKYARLSRAQERLVADIAAIAPHVLYPTADYPTYPQLTSNASGTIWTFGTDADGNAIAPIGRTQIFADLSHIPDFPWLEGRDYLNEGTQIRIPNNLSYAGTLYWRGITRPVAIDAMHQPALFPPASRELIAVEAVRQFAMEGARNPELAALMTAEKDALWRKWALTWRTAFRRGGGLVYGTVTGLQLALAAQ